MMSSSAARPGRPVGGVVVAIDQGTSSTKGLAVDESGTVVAQAGAALGQSNPQPGWVEQDPRRLLAGVEQVLDRLCADAGAPVAAVALSTQRESTLTWDTRTGEPLSPVIGWQDRRTAAAAARFAAADAARIRALSGLPLDPMFSALKIAWILDEVDPDRSRARRGEITVGTVDAWLARRLTGERRIERGNASRTQLLDVATGEWSPELLDAFDVPAAALPRLVASDAPAALGGAGRASLGPLTAVMGDSHAALFGHGVRRPGAVKATYGTGSSIMGLSTTPAASAGLAHTIAWEADGRIARAFEGNILSTGATLVWLAELLGVSPAEIAVLAQDAADDGGIDLVPAFAGLGAPWWDPRAVGVIAGLTLGTSRTQLARAALESIVLQIEDVLAAADAALGGAGIGTIHVDGGPSSNDWLMQRQADLSGRAVVRPARAALSALGAAWLAGSACGIWSPDTAPWAGSAEGAPKSAFTPLLAPEARAARRARWACALERARLDAASAQHTSTTPTTASTT
ncbi:MAG: FGGY family carbohydrate kinase [Microbacteriaceae bacterium]|nr:FGGY family carbohydrate kinase [Microbacteriaceae bacterium]